MGNINQLLRGAFERSRDKFPNFIIQRMEFRLELPLRTNQNSYSFTLKQGSATSDGPNSVLLNDQDAFVLLATRLYAMKQNPSTTPVQYNNSQRFTYPEPQVFVGAPAGQATEYQSLWTLWNGQLSFKTGSLERIKPIDTYSHLYIPQAQVIPNDDNFNPLTAPSLAEFNGPNSQMFGYVEHQPTILLDGSQNNIFTVTLGSGDISGIDGSYLANGDQGAVTRNYIGLNLLGLLIMEGSTAAKRFDKSWE